MKREVKWQYINNFLKDLYQSVCDQDLMLNHNIVYNYLINFGVPVESKKRGNVSDFFGSWIARFRSRENIDVFNSPNWKYFCQFINGDVNYDCIKLYIPLDHEHIYEGVNLIFDFLEKNNIKHVSKVGSHFRFDNVVVRLNSIEDAEKLQFFIDSNQYIQSGLMKANPFAFSNNGVSYAYDGCLSYNSCLSTIISEYIREMRKEKIDISQINVNTFLTYVDKFGKSRESIMSLSDGYHDSSIGYGALIVDLIKTSLLSDNMQDYYNNYNRCVNIDKEQLSNEIKCGHLNNVSDKEELFKELILVTMKKYPKGYDRENPNVSGFDYIFDFLYGNIRAVTRDNNLRNRVSQNLNMEDIYNIINNSGVVGNNLKDKVSNYVKKVMLDEVIRCMDIRSQDSGRINIDRFMRTNDSCYITNKVDNARRLVYTMDAEMMRTFLVEHGVVNIFDYINQYYNVDNVNGRRK